MNPKEKAKQLVDSYIPFCGMEMTEKKCALIAVNEILRSNPHSNPLNTDVYSTFDYWIDVREEIKKL